MPTDVPLNLYFQHLTEADRMLTIRPSVDVK